MTGVEILSYEWFGNTVQQYAIAVAAFFVAMAVLRFVQRLIVRRAQTLAEKTDTDIDDTMVNVVASIKPQFYWFLAFYAAIQFLQFEGAAKEVIDVVVVAWVVYQVVVALQLVLDRYVSRKLIQEDDRASEVMTSLITGVGRIVLWSLALLFVLSNVGVDVTSLIAGLGIGGIAVALALQNVLSDLFSSLAIYFDRPFAPGDFITVGDMSGTVKKVGIKTTRIKSLSGEEIVIPNNDITSSRLHNFKRMEKRRVNFTLGVEYGTPQDKMKAVPDMVRAAVEAADNTEFGRVHFHEFANSSLVFDVVYYVTSREYETFMDAHQAVLLGIKKAFEEASISMAFPTQTVHVETMPNAK